MKLRNKKTGEVHEITEARFINADIKVIIYSQTEGHNHAYKTLAELNEEWEDYEESKEYWYIDRCYEAHATNPTLRNITADQQIGNYFETEEEAELAVQKLKAWKRLKDKDFQFHGHNALGVGEITFSLDFEDMDDEGEIGQLRHDLDLLFGGEE